MYYTHWKTDVRALEPQETAALASRLMIENGELRERITALEAENRKLRDSETIRDLSRQFAECADNLGLPADTEFAKADAFNNWQWPETNVYTRNQDALERKGLAASLISKIVAGPLPQSETDRMWDAVRMAAQS